MTSVVLDTHVLLWWSTDSGRVSARAASAMAASDDLAVADVTWYELAWLARHERILISIPILSWLNELSSKVRTIPISPSIAAAAAGLSSTFPGDPVDRLIFATAVENGSRLVTKDERILKFRHPQPIAIW